MVAESVLTAAGWMDELFIVLFTVQHISEQSGGWRKKNIWPPFFFNLKKRLFLLPSQKDWVLHSWKLVKASRFSEAEKQWICQLSLCPQASENAAALETEHGYKGMLSWEASGPWKRNLKAWIVTKTEIQFYIFWQKLKGVI